MFRNEKKELILSVFAFIFFVLLFSNFSSAALSCNFNATCVYPSFPLLYVQNDTGGYYNAHAQNTTLISLQGLVGWWRLDNTSIIGENSSRVFDWSGLGNNGTPTSGAAVSSNGKLRNAYTFDGVDDYITVPYSASLAPVTQTFSISAWFNSSSFSGSQRIVSKTETGGYQLSINENGVCPVSTLCFTAYNGSAYNVVSTPTSGLALNRWYMVTAT
jgi:hypothetical protein